MGIVLFCFTRERLIRMEQSSEKYLASLQQLIAQTREDAGYNLNWCIAQVSYAWSNYNNTKKMESMKETQRAACNDETIFVGPTTDDLQGEYRHTDNLHLSKLGLLNTENAGQMLCIIK